MTKAQQSEQEQARETLRAILPPGTKVYTILRDVSRSGMQSSTDYRRSYDEWLDRVTAFPVVIEEEPMPAIHRLRAARKADRRARRLFKQARRLGVVRG